MTQLPFELWERIANYADKTDLNKLIRASKAISSPSLTVLWETIRLSPKVSLQTWRSLIDLLDSEMCRKYVAHVRNIDDIWLFVGGECNSADSAVDLYRYSLSHALELLMRKCAVKSMKLSLYSDALAQLPWTNVSLQSLELGMRVTDKLLISIIPTQQRLESLLLQRAEISDASLACISEHCRLLKRLQIEIVPMNSRSNYHRSTDKSCDSYITKSGFDALLDLNLFVLNVRPLDMMPAEGYKPCALEELSITLASAFNVHGETIIDILKGYSDTLKVLHLHGCLYGLLYDKVLPDSVLMDIPLILRIIKKITLKNISLSRVDEGCTKYYGPKEMTWYMDEFRSQFRARYPKVELVLIT